MTVGLQKQVLARFEEDMKGSDFGTSEGKLKECSRETEIN